MQHKKEAVIVKKIEILAPDDLVFVINGKEWRMPGDVEIGIVMEVIALDKKLNKNNSEDSAYVIEKIEELIRKLFLKRHSKEEVDKLKLGVNALIQIATHFSNYLGDWVPKNQQPGPGKNRAGK